MMMVKPDLVTVRVTREAYDILGKIAEKNFRDRRNQLSVILLELGQKEGIIVTKRRDGKNI